MTLGQAAAGPNFVDSQELYSVLRRLGIQSRHRRLCGEILSLALVEREAYPQNEIATRFGAAHLDGERADNCRTSSSCDSCLLASFGLPSARAFHLVIHREVNKARARCSAARYRVG